MKTAVDIVFVVIFALYMIGGYSKGLVRSLLESLSMIISLVVSAVIAGTYQRGFCDAFVLKVLEALLSGKASSVDLSKVPGLSALLDLMGENAAEDISFLAGDIIESLSSAVQLQALDGFAMSVSYTLLFVITFIILSALLNAAIMMVDTAFKLPVINVLNNTGGAAIGALKGYIVCGIICVVISYIIVSFASSPDAPLTQQFVDDTYLLKFIYHSFPVSSFLFK